MAMQPFEAIVAEHGPVVMRVCRALLGPVEADDAWSETFLAALRAYPSLREVRNLRGWLVTIAHRKAIDHHRARGRAPVPVESVREEAVFDPDPGDGEVWRSVAALPPKQRAAVTLRFASDLPHEEIAAALGCSPEAARRSLYEGLKRLRKEMA
jgi:RNA polymerase sigma factor (sigma-70 family)